MNEQDHIDLLQLQTAALTERTRFCPGDQEIAEYFDGDLPQAVHAKFEHHLADCHFCLARIGVLERLENSRANKRVHEEVLATAKQMQRSSPPHRSKIVPAWAAAAVVVIAMFAIISIKEPGLPVEIATGEATSIENVREQLRSLNRDATVLDIFSPKPGASIGPGSRIQWAEVSGNLHYNIYVLSNTGDVLWTQRLEGTEWALHESLQLAADSTYYFRVEAQLPDGRNLSSRHLSFRIAAQQ